MDYLGLTMEDRITGFRGVVTGYAKYLTGCSQVLLASRGDGSKRETEWFDEQRLTVVDGVERIVLDNGATPGCDAQAPIR